jgi:Protein of unknown function (DUF2946)
VTSSSTRSATSRPNALLQRIMALVLLAFVAYVATAGVVHRHGGLSVATHGSAAAAINPAGDAGSSANDSRAVSDCLICQLRQQLSFSLLNAPPLILAPPAQLARMPRAVLSCFSRTDTPQRGRAPPLASLI